MGVSFCRRDSVPVVALSEPGQTRGLPLQTGIAAGHPEL